MGDVVKAEAVKEVDAYFACRKQGAVLPMLELLFLRCWKGYKGKSSIVKLGREKEVLVVEVPTPRLLLLSRVHGMSETRTTARR